MWRIVEREGEYFILTCFESFSQQIAHLYAVAGQKARLMPMWMKRRKSQCGSQLAAMILVHVQFGVQLTEKQRKELRVLTKEFAAVLNDKLGRTALEEHHIETGTARPVRIPAYRIPHAYREQVRQEIEEMLEAGMIEPSSSGWNSPIVRRMGHSEYVWTIVVSVSDAYPCLA